MILIEIQKIMVLSYIYQHQQIQLMAHLLQQLKDKEQYSIKR